MLDANADSACRSLVAALHHSEALGIAFQRVTAETGSCAPRGPRYSQAAVSRKQPASYSPSSENQSGRHHGSKAAVRPPATVTS